MTTTLVLAGLSARMMVEAAVRDGYAALALDLFGDVDTRRLAAGWAGIGEPGAMRIDRSRFLAGLKRFAVREGVLGWVAGSGFEGQPALLEAGAKILPLIGTPAPAVRRVRDPRVFFAFLAALRIAHPEVRLEPPGAAGWLSKDADGSGGWHIRHAESDELRPDTRGRRYYQRHAPGRPMSALFVANSLGATVLGFNELIVRRVGRRPFVYCGAIGPIPLAPDVAASLDEVVQSLAAAFRLEGLCSLDFLLDGSRFSVLEINPRPSASMALYGGLPGTLLMHSHVQACLHGRAAATPRHAEVRGTEVVFARRMLHLNVRAARRLASLAHTHDLPAAGAAFAEDDPVCSVSAVAAEAPAVRARLAARREAVLDQLESVDEHSPAHLQG
jgi:predicted ATP-grasp superfamily ATP-dependent carboligase